jgi:hypothetical protein
MKEEENIAEYFQIVDEIVNSIGALGEELKDKIQPLQNKRLKNNQSDMKIFL